MPWVPLGAAIATEVALSPFAPRTGSPGLVPSIIVAVGYLASFGLLALVAILDKIMFNDPVPRSRSWEWS
jgi:multidrug transporter EmrE-like cation transporter